MDILIKNFSVVGSNKSPFLILCIYLLCLCLPIYAQTNESIPEAKPLPAGLTPEEKEILDKIGELGTVTPAPEGIFRLPAEYEQADGYQVVRVMYK